MPLPFMTDSKMPVDQKKNDQNHPTTSQTYEVKKDDQKMKTESPLKTAETSK